MEEPTTFIQKVRAAGQSLEITIDSRVCQYEGLKEGDLLKVAITKLPPKEEPEEF